MKHLNNHVIIVTGAASGIGQQVAIQAAERGALVIATDINTEGLNNTQKSIADGQCMTFVLDVANAEAIENFAQKIIPMLQNRPLVLVNNAGVALNTGDFLSTSMADFEWLLSINLWGVIRMTKAFLPYMVAQNAGHIVNISSVFGLAGVARQSAYCTAKFGVRGFTETLRMELYDTPIKTTCVHPGGIKTNIARAARVGGSVSPQEHLQNADMFEDKLTPTLPSEAARQILEAVRTQKQKLVIGNDGKFFNFITRLMPVGYTKYLKKMLDKAQAAKKL
jgi:NADP-dependent 3-hydroxy acid dehydrogenase YdfG